MDWVEDYSNDAPDYDEMFLRRLPKGEIRWMVRIRTPGTDEVTRCTPVNFASFCIHSKTNMNTPARKEVQRAEALSRMPKC